MSSKRNAGVGLGAVLLGLLIASAGTSGGNLPGYDLTVNPWGSLPFDQTAGNVNDQCNDGIDNDGDGLSDQDDPSCIFRTDAVGYSASAGNTPNGICDGRLWDMSGLEGAPNYATHPSPFGNNCIGWE